VDTWPGKFDTIPPAFAALVRTLARYEPVHVLAGGAGVLQQACSMVGDVNGVTLWDIETNDAWCRDHGPTFLAAPSGQPPALIDWQYNAWGGKYPPFDKDNAVPRHIARQLGRRRFACDFFLEGGSIEGNGCGTVLTTATCLLHPNRNPRGDPAGVNELLRDFLGARNVLWLERGELAGDDTDGHIDQLARFVGRSTVVASVAADPSDENHAPLQANFDQLCKMTDEEGRPLDVHPLPLPQPKFYRGHRLPASYANFYIANGVVLVPQFDDPADATAIRLLQEHFPDREVRGIPCLDLAWGLGAIHCLTQQEPRSH
jgi:agmatine deiminase